MKQAQKEFSPSASCLAKLADDRGAVERIASAADLTTTSVRTMLRTGTSPRNRHVRAPYQRSLDRELRKVVVSAENGN